MEEVQENSLEQVKGDNPYEAQLKQLEAENKKLRDEFDCQRAKMKELYLQREEELSRRKSENETLNSQLHKTQSELDEVKSQLLVADMQLENNVADEKRKAAEEIASLQQLVHETVEESSSSRSIYDCEVKKLHTIIHHLQEENRELKSDKQHSPHHAPQETSSLAPSTVLSVVTKKLAKKLGADAFTSQDDDHREDTELLKSLVGPLEEEIKALKDKLRSTDDQLQKYQLLGHSKDEGDQSLDKSPLQSTATNTSFEARPPHCDMCSNYEAQLVKEQKHTSDLGAKLALAEKSVERHKEDLVKEIGFRKDMEEKWNEKKEEHKKLVADLNTRMSCAEQDLTEVQETFKQTCDLLRQKLATLKRDREKVQLELERLQKENDNLVGKYSIHSQQLQSESINLPDTVEELQELLLKSYQDLIIAKIAKEASEEEANTLRSDIMLLKDQIVSDQHNTQVMEDTLVAELSQLKNEKHILETERKGYMSNLARFKEKEKETAVKLDEVKSELDKVIAKKTQLDEKNKELKTRVQSLQQELDNSETVQKDFVKLSQNLQMELEKIRDADTQVRWQHEEDAEECPACRQLFSGAKRKEHCRHCGQIFCTVCLTHVVPSGPHLRPSRVCTVCHTLLVKSSAPYFSTEAPHSPD